MSMIYIRGGWGSIYIYIYYCLVCLLYEFQLRDSRVQIIRGYMIILTNDEYPAIILIIRKNIKY